MIKITDTRNHGRVCLLSQSESKIFFLVHNVQFEFSRAKMASIVNKVSCIVAEKLPYESLCSVV